MGDENHQNSPESNDPSSEAPDPSSTPEEPGEQQDGTEEEPPDVAKLRREAAGHRAKLRETEAERDVLLAQRDALAATVLADALHGTGISAEAFAAAGHEIASFITDDGRLDRPALTAAARETARRFGSPGGRSPYTGTGDERPEEGKSWAEVLQQ